MDFDSTFEDYRRSLDEFEKGNPEPTKKMWSHRDDATLYNPFHSLANGWTEVAKTLESAASQYRGGTGAGTSYENLVKYVTQDLAYVVGVEKHRVKVAGASDFSPRDLRATLIFRLEGGEWKVLHRHADPITSAQPVNR